MDVEYKVKDLLSEIQKKGHLPALDRNVGALCSLADNPLTQAAELTAIILRDTALTTSVLSAANSAAYRTVSAIKTVSAAVILLGFEKVQALALGLSIFKQSHENARTRELYRLFTCSYFAGTLAMSLARQANYGNPEEASIAGLLLQLPRLLLANSFPEKYEQMEKLIMDKRIPPPKACEQVFGVTYADIAHGISRLWNLPAGITGYFKILNPAGKQLNQIIRSASDVSDMLFGNAPGGSEKMAAAEKEMKELLNVEDFSVSRFIGFACEADDNMNRFFNLGRQDMEMMFKIAEWGRVNSAQVAASLTLGAGLKEKESPPEDPHILIGNFLTELMVVLRARVGINEILMVAQEAIYRCLTPSCVFTAFLDKARQHVIGRLYAGNSVMIQAGDFRFGMSDKSSALVECMERMKSIRANIKTHKITLPPDLLGKLNLEHILLSPIIALDHSVGLFLVGRSSDRPFSDEELSWQDAIAGHVGLAFETEDRTRPSKGTG